MTKRQAPNASQDAQTNAQNAPATQPGVDAPSENGSHGATSRLPLLLRIVSFVAAAVLSVMGIHGLVNAINVQSAAQSITSASMRPEALRHVMVLMSYDESDASVTIERDALLDTLNRSGISSDVFYLDARADRDEQASQAQLNHIRSKAASSGGYDTIIAVGDEALSFVSANQELFGGIPTAFFAVDDAQLAAQAEESGIATGFVEQGGPAVALAAAQELLAPEQVVVLTDASAEARGLLAQLEADASAAPTTAPREVWDVSTLSRDELAERLGALDDSTTVLVLAANCDADGNVYTPSDTAHWLAAQSASPLFSARGNVGDGIWGAPFTNRSKEAVQAAERATQLLNGADPASFANETVVPECMSYDVSILDAHHISTDALPADAALVNESVLSWRVLRPMLGPLMLLLGALVFVTIFAMVGYGRSVNSRNAIIATNKSLEHRLTHDLLTELPNRHALEQFAESDESAQTMQAVVQVDIEDFSDINDSYGHSFGNIVIQKVARRLREIPTSLLVRSGGDEFIMCVDHPLNPQSAEIKAIASAFAEPVTYDDNKVELSVRAGIANRAADMPADELIIASDLATKYAKANAMRRPVFYDNSMRKAMEQKLEITTTLKRDIAEEAIVVVWQPQVDTETLEVYGYEALCRLADNAYYPSDFIPVAEMSGLVLPLDRIMTKKVVEQLGLWLREGRKVGVASINFSAAQLRDKGYVDFLKDLLETYDVPASYIKIEITESMLIGKEEDADKLFAQLRAMGISLALDDFGTGYSSLARLASMPTDFIKLDKSLVDAFMVQGKEDFIDHVTQLVHGLGKRLVVEGVETYDQYEICQRLGCDVIQGYFFSKPISAEEIERFDPSAVLADAKLAAGDKTRNPNWSKYARDSNGRWQKKQ